MALVYSMSQLLWGWKGLSWPVFSTWFKLSALRRKLEVKQNPGHNFLPQWSILFSLKVSTCLSSSSLQWGENGICLAWCLLCQAMWLFSLIWVQDMNGLPHSSHLRVCSMKKRRTRDDQAAVKPLLFTALNKICLWITHTEHHVLLKMLEINVPEINIKQNDVGIPFAIIKHLKITICLTSAVNTCFFLLLSHSSLLILSVISMWL